MKYIKTSVHVIFIRSSVFSCDSSDICKKSLWQHWKCLSSCACSTVLFSLVSQWKSAMMVEWCRSRQPAAFTPDYVFACETRFQRSKSQVGQGICSCVREAVDALQMFDWHVLGAQPSTALTWLVVTATCVFEFRWFVTSLGPSTHFATAITVRLVFPFVLLVQNDLPFLLSLS